ncbi:MAG: ABC transporter substrate-binding protein [Anaerolineae bacterium]|nr:ABC transporter substrate-binding protein [Anaerolineae bacterium]
MYKKLALIAVIVLAMLMAAPGLAQDAENPTIAFLRYGGSSLISLSEKGILDMLQAYGMINEEERAVLDESEDLEGEHINVIYRDAGFDLPTVNLMIEDALDNGADVLLTLSTPVTQLAANITREMDDPPQIIFAIVGTPYFAGVADTPCVKDDHIAGTQTDIPYEQYVNVLPTFNPDLKVIGTIVNASQANSVFGAERIEELAGELGIAVETAGVTTLSDLPLATEGLISKGAEAIVVPGGYTVSIGMSAIVDIATENGIAVFSPVSQHVYRGATVGAGFYSLYREGVIAARMLVAHINGEVDLSRTRINLTPGFTVALNLDSAAEAGVEISEELLAMADWTIKDGGSSEGVSPELPEIGIELPAMTLDERREADLEFLAGIHCTDEMISEQKRQLETQWSD